MNKQRFEAFSDGVFAFAVTLLVLGIVLPPLRTPSDAELTASLLKLWPNVVAYALSFAVIGIMWQNHHALFRLVERLDRTTVFLNLLLLGATVFVPFATSALGTYPTLHASTFLYGLVLSTASSFFNLLLIHLIRANAFHKNVSQRAIHETVIAYRVGLVVYVSATLLALVIPLASFAAYLLIVAYYLLPRGVDADAQA
jgi:uncharacterized membrane protein